MLFLFAWNIAAFFMATLEPRPCVINVYICDTRVELMEIMCIFIFIQNKTKNNRLYIGRRFGRYVLLILQSFDWLAAFHLGLLQVILLIAV